MVKLYILIYQAAAARVSAILKSKKPAKTIKKREQKGARKVRA